MYSPLHSELVVCKNFKLVKKLGTGAFGEIYLAENRSNTTERYAAKLEETATKFPQLYYEAKIYKYLNSFGPAPGIPKVPSLPNRFMLLPLRASTT
jgi:serine/threonine protein kinase